MFLLVLLLDASLALGVDEAATGAGAGLATEHTALAGSAVARLADGTTDAEEDHGEEVGGKGCPGPAKAVATETGILTVATESVAALNEACTVKAVSGC